MAATRQHANFDFGLATWVNGQFATVFFLSFLFCVFFAKPTGRTVRRI